MARKIIVAYKYKVEGSHAISQWQQKVIRIAQTDSIATMHELVYDALIARHFNPETTGDELLMFYITGEQ